MSHRDLKLENLMLLNDEAAAEVKLIDFGFSKIFQVRLPCHVSLPAYSSRFTALMLLMPHASDAIVDALP